MATDYILYIHGVNNRIELGQADPSYADKLIEQIENAIGKSDKLKQIPLYWGNVNQTVEQKLLRQVKDQSDVWQQLWFQEFRETTLLPFIGDAASYISRTVGSKVVEVLKQQMKAKGLDKASSNDRLHLVTHSWGTVILFDVLFAARWNDQNISGYESVKEIRSHFYGVEPNPQDGIRVASIHTMGSPIALFSLLDIVRGEEQAAGQSELTEKQARQRASHDITPQLKELLTRLGERIKPNKLTWRNYIHPGDPVAWPLDPLMYSLVDGVRKVVDLKDIISELSFSENLLLPISQTPAALLINGGNAHGSYFTNTDVAQEIVQSIRKAATIS